jgi:ribose transport system permease protein
MLPLLAAVAGLLVLFRVWVPGFLAPDNMLDLAQQISVNAIIAFGMTLVILTGGIDLSVGALVALVGTTTVYGLIALGGTDTQSAPGLGAAMLLGLGAAAAVGLVNGLCAAKTRMPPFIITLATMLIARGAALRFNEGRPMHIPEVNTLFLWLGNGRVVCVVPWPVPVLVMFVLFALAAVLLHRTRFGQHLYAMGGNREAALFTGVPVARIEVVVYVLGSLLAAVAGMINASQLYSAERVRTQRDCRGGRRRYQFHGRPGDHGRHADRRRHHRHPGQGPQPGRRPFLAPVHRQRPCDPGRGVHGRSPRQVTAQGVGAGGEAQYPAG